MSEYDIDAVVTTVVTVRSEKSISEVCRKKLGIESDSGIFRIISDAKKKIEESAIVDRVQEIGKALIRLDELYEKAMILGKPETALAIMKERAKLLGLYGNVSSKPENEWGIDGE